MGSWLKQSVAVEIKVGPFVDNVDGFTAEAALTITNTEVLLSKNDGDWAAKNETTSLVHESNGWYRCLLNTTDTNTLGILRLQIAETGALPVFAEFMVVPAQVWDSLFGADVLQVDAIQLLGSAIATPTVAGVLEADVTHIGGDAQSATDLKDFVDAGYDPATNKVEGVKLADSLTAVAASGINAASLAADMDSYTGKVSVVPDTANSVDRWTMVWFKNGVPLTAGVSACTLQVIKHSDNSDLIAATTMTQEGSTESFTLDEATNRIVAGASYEAKVLATIGGSQRPWAQPIGKPS